MLIILTLNPSEHLIVTLKEILIIICINRNSKYSVPDISINCTFIKLFKLHYAIKVIL
jgi:hypothetical protein